MVKVLKILVLKLFLFLFCFAFGRLGGRSSCLGRLFLLFDLLLEEETPLFLAQRAIARAAVVVAIASTIIDNNNKQKTFVSFQMYFIYLFFIHLCTAAFENVLGEERCCERG